MPRCVCYGLFISEMLKGAVREKCSIIKYSIKHLRKFYTKIYFEQKKQINKILAKKISLLNLQELPVCSHSFWVVLNL